VANGSAGVDFGTTFTSVAFAHSASPEDVKLVQTWPNGSIGNSSADQVPSVVYYTNPRTRAKCWGYEAPPPAAQEGTPHEALRWFKLLLQENPTSRRRNDSARRSSLSPFLEGWGSTSLHTASSTRNPLSAFHNLAIDSGSSDAPFAPPTITPALKTAQKLDELRIPPVTVVEDFLAAVRNIAIDSIKRTYESQWVEDSKISYVLTVPAIWSDSAKNLMIQAAQRAGYGIHRVDFDLISEPEAAAAYTLKAIQPNSLRVSPRRWPKPRRNYKAHVRLSRSETLLSSWTLVVAQCLYYPFTQFTINPINDSWQGLDFVQDHWPESSAAQRIRKRQRRSVWLRILGRKV
jgi:hypothetical protein